MVTIAAEFQLVTKKTFLELQQVQVPIRRRCCTVDYFASPSMDLDDLDTLSPHSSHSDQSSFCSEVTTDESDFCHLEVGEQCTDVAMNFEQQQQLPPGCFYPETGSLVYMMPMQMPVMYCGVPTQPQSPADEIAASLQARKAAFGEQISELAAASLRAIANADRKPRRCRTNKK